LPEGRHEDHRLLDDGGRHGPGADHRADGRDPARRQGAGGRGPGGPRGAGADGAAGIRVLQGVPEVQRAGVEGALERRRLGQVRAVPGAVHRPAGRLGGVLRARGCGLARAAQEVRGGRDDLVSAVQLAYYILNTYVPELDGPAGSVYEHYLEQVTAAEAVGFD